MLDTETKRRIDTARDILVGKVPDPKSQVEQITIALIYKFMDDMDKESVSLGGEATFFAPPKYTGNKEEDEKLIDFSKYSWTNIFDTKVGGHEMLALYGEAITNLNLNPNIPQLFRDIFKNAYLPYRDPETLKLFLKTINEFSYDHSEMLGDAFEYLLSVLGSQGDAGQFRTPRHIIDFIVEVLQPKKTETICDPACGTAGFLISSYKQILQQNTKKNKGDMLTPDDRKKMMQNFVGYDISPDMVRLSLVNMYLHGFTTPSIYEYDTLTSEERWSEYFDVIIANPPFMSPKGGIKPHKKFTIQANRSEVLFVDYIAEHIHPSKGRAGIIIPEGIIFQSGTAYKALRKMLVDKNMLYAVVSLPAGIFQPYSGVKTSILLMDKTLAKKTDNILFVKIDNDGFDLGAQRKEFDKNDLPEALQILQRYRECLQSNGTFETENKNVLLIEKKKIGEKGDYILSLDRYRVNENIQQSNFDILKLGEVAEVISGQSPESEFYNDQKQGMPFFQGKTEFGEMYIGEPKTWTTKITKTAIKDDILMSVRAPVGPVNIATQEICIGRGIAAIRPNEKILLTYLFAFLKSIQDEIKGSGGAVFDSINRNQIMEIEIPVPPISIQKIIASKLESYQIIIDAAKKIAENYKPQIDIDADCEVVKLSEVCEVISGFSFDSKEFSNKNSVKSIKITNVGVGYFVETDEDFLPKEYSLKHKKFSANEDDIVIALTRSIIGAGLKVSLVPKSYNGALVNQRVALIKSDSKKINNHFVFLQLKSQKSFDYIEEKARSLMQPNLSIKDLADLEIQLPSLSVQEEIVKKIEQEQQLVNGSKQLIQIFEQKIKDEINKLWQAAPKEYAIPEEKLSIAAEE